MNEIWRVWKYALGSFSDEKTKRYDNSVLFVRSFIFLTYLITNCFIVAGVIRHWNPMSKIDTQGMSGPSTGGGTDNVYPHDENGEPILPRAVITPRREHTPQMVKELKILINEVLDEREGKFNYTSYFDVDKYKYYVGEEEPEYNPHHNSYLRLDEIQE